MLPKEHFDIEFPCVRGEEQYSRRQEFIVAIVVLLLSQRGVAFIAGMSQPSFSLQLCHCNPDPGQSDVWLH